ncbi:alpha/beta fold hydrolase [Actinoplanes sp. CA-030573]|uniref:alpha/beta fold hydrolase n=1 Tax=Actinoplanes sp. CA-030573 TaxID=3239898 RepID=UPI003D8D09E9
MSSHGMHVVHDGPLDGPPLVLIHGSGAAGGCWGPMVPMLAARHHVIRVDLPGCGRSAPPASYAVPDQAARVAALLDELGLRHVTVAGHSSGGYVATALAERRPELVRSIALISCGPRLDALLPQPLLLRVLMAPPLGRLLWSRRSDELTRKGLASIAAGPVEIPDEAVAELRGTTYSAFRGVMRGNGAYVSAESVPHRLAALGFPVLVIFGAADPRWDPESARQYYAVPDVRIEMLAGVGHLPMFEDPEATGKLLLDFAA